VVAVSALVKITDAASANAHDIDAFVPKPFASTSSPSCAPGSAPGDRASSPVGHTAVRFPHTTAAPPSVHPFDNRAVWR
jgi:hypothetical protein